MISMLKSQRRAFRWPNNFRARLYITISRNNYITNSRNDYITNSRNDCITNSRNDYY